MDWRTSIACWVRQNHPNYPYVVLAEIRPNELELLLKKLNADGTFIKDSAVPYELCLVGFATMVDAIHVCRSMFQDPESYCLVFN